MLRLRWVVKHDGPHFGNATGWFGSTPADGQRSGPPAREKPFGKETEKACQSAMSLHDHIYMGIICHGGEASC